jgi:hypothetical protein
MKELIEKYVGKKFKYNPMGSSLTFEVRSSDLKHAYGRTDVLIHPEAGSGSKWVSVESLKIIE